MALNSKLKNSINKIAVEFCWEANFKFSKILKNVGGVAILVNEIEQKVYGDTADFWGFSAIEYIFLEILSWHLQRICNLIVLIE